MESARKHSDEEQKSFECFHEHKAVCTLQEIMLL